MLALLAGCQTNFDGPAANAPQPAVTPDLDAEIARASSSQQPIFVLVTESGRSRADDRARKLLESFAARGKLGNIVPVVLDVSVSRNRATAARFHVTNTPVLFGLSPKGLIVSRDDGGISKDQLLNRIGEIAERGSDADAQLAFASAAVARDGNNATAQWELAGFLLGQQNDREAIPHLEFVARDEAAGTTLRIRAWVELVRAHFWIMEPEKGRHEAEDLIATLGPKTADARAAGNLLLGIQDATAKRVTLARREFEAAIAAEPESAYATQASEALAKLPGEAK